MERIEWNNLHQFFAHCFILFLFASTVCFVLFFVCPPPPPPGSHRTVSLFTAVHWITATRWSDDTSSYLTMNTASLSFALSVFHSACLFLWLVRSFWSTTLPPYPPRRVSSVRSSDFICPSFSPSVPFDVCPCTFGSCLLVRLFRLRCSGSSLWAFFFLSHFFFLCFPLSFLAPLYFLPFLSFHSLLSFLYFSFFSLFSLSPGALFDRIVPSVFFWWCFFFRCYSCQAVRGQVAACPSCLFTP